MFLVFPLVYLLEIHLKIQSGVEQVSFFFKRSVVDHFINIL